MTCKIYYQPETDGGSSFYKGGSDIYAEIEYDMFEEMEGEFDRANFVLKETKKMTPSDYDNGKFLYDLTLDYPYGAFNVKLTYAKKVTKEDEI